MRVDTCDMICAGGRSVLPPVVFGTGGTGKAASTKPSSWQASKARGMEIWGMFFCGSPCFENSDVSKKPKSANLQGCIRTLE